MNGLWNLIDLMQDAVDTEPYDTRIAPWLNMNIARALFERILPKPVNNANDVTIIGVRRDAATLRAQLHQLFKRRDAALVVNRSVLRSPHRLCQCEELSDVAFHIKRIGKHQLHAAAQQIRQLGNPRTYERFAGRHRYRL